MDSTSDNEREAADLLAENLVLHKEIENRSAEVAVINSVMEGLASSKDIGNI